MIILNELFNNGLFIIISITLFLYITYKVLNRKDKDLERLEGEYNELLTLDKYKVKGQY